MPPAAPPARWLADALALWLHAATPGINAGGPLYRQAWVNLGSALDAWAGQPVPVEPADALAALWALVRAGPAQWQVMDEADAPAYRRLMGQLARAAHCFSPIHAPTRGKPAAVALLSTAVEQGNQDVLLTLLDHPDCPPGFIHQPIWPLPRKHADRWPALSPNDKARPRLSLVGLGLLLHHAQPDNELLRRCLDGILARADLSLPITSVGHPAASLATTAPLVDLIHARHGTPALLAPDPDGKPAFLTALALASPRVLAGPGPLLTTTLAAHGATRDPATLDAASATLGRRWALTHPTGFEQVMAASLALPHLAGPQWSLAQKFDTAARRLASLPSPAKRPDVPWPEPLLQFLLCREGINEHLANLPATSRALAFVLHHLGADFGATSTNCATLVSDPPARAALLEEIARPGLPHRLAHMACQTLLRADPHVDPALARALLDAVARQIVLQWTPQDASAPLLADLIQAHLSQGEPSPSASWAFVQAMLGADVPPGPDDRPIVAQACRRWADTALHGPHVRTLALELTLARPGPSRPLSRL